MITYSTNWMGPISMSWYRDRNLVRKVTGTYTNEHMATKYSKNVGDTYEYDEVVTLYCGGRIDVYGTDDMFGTEIGLPVMRSDCWNQFTDWLDTVETDDVWTLDQLIELYQRDNPPIVWASELKE